MKLKKKEGRSIILKQTEQIRFSNWLDLGLWWEIGESDICASINIIRSSLKILELQWERFSRGKKYIQWFHCYLLKFLKILVHIEEYYVKCWDDNYNQFSSPIFLPGKSHGQRSLVGYSLWGLQSVRHDWVTESYFLTRSHLFIFAFISVTLGGGS